MTPHSGGKQGERSASHLLFWDRQTVVQCDSGSVYRTTMEQQAQRRRLSAEDMARGVGMLLGGSSQREVAGALGVSQSVVSRFWNRYQTTGTVTPRHSGGHPRVTTQREDRYLLVQSRRSPFHNATQLQHDLQNASGNRVSTQTVRRRLHDGGLHSRAPAIRVPLTRQHKQARLLWALEHQGWTAANWTPVLFSDESRFCLDVTDRRRRVWRRQNERFTPTSLLSMTAMVGAQ